MGQLTGQDLHDPRMNAGADRIVQQCVTRSVKVDDLASRVAISQGVLCLFTPPIVFADIDFRCTGAVRTSASRSRCIAFRLRLAMPPYVTRIVARVTVHTNHELASADC